MTLPDSIPPVTPSPDEGTFSPHWGITTKLVVSLALAAVVAWLLLRFQGILGPLLLAVLLAYLFYPVAVWCKKVTHMSWRLVVTLLFALALVLMLGLTTLGGLAVVEQAQSLIRFLSSALGDLPKFLADMSAKSINFGPFAFKINLTDLNGVGQNLLGSIQPMLNQAGNLVGTIATGAASFIGTLFFMLLVAYFILAESGGNPGGLIRVKVPGYEYDLGRLNTYLGGIWNAFLRGQLTIIAITIVVYIVLLNILGVHFALGLAFLAGMARFVPYVGPFIAWTSYGLVAFFQGSNMFGLTPLGYVLLVVGSAWVMDIILDNFVATRLMGNALQVHPAAIMVTALIGANVLGVVGVVLAAPVVATLKLFSSYLFNKLLDRDPWADLVTMPAGQDLNGLGKQARRIADLFSGWLARQRRKKKTSDQ